jgi:L-threonylcarbamoyladenylate synthase
MLKLTLMSNNADAAAAEAIKILKNGGVVAYPTESFYALGVMAVDEQAVHKLYQLKKRPSKKAMPVIVGNNEVLETVVKSIPSQAITIMEEFWPGALTLIFDAGDYLPRLLLGSTEKIAVRIPGYSFALDLAVAAGFPVTATSANISGNRPASCPDEIVRDFNEDIDLIVDGGDSPGGKPSTIVDVTVVPPKILREGRIPLNKNNL